MNSFIRRLQLKKEDTRKQILLLSLILSMSFVVFVWVYNLSDRFSNKDTAVKTEDGLKPFTLFANSISNAYNNISASVGKISSKDKTDENTQKQIDLIVVEPKTNQ